MSCCLLLAARPAAQESFSLESFNRERIYATKTAMVVPGGWQTNAGSMQVSMASGYMGAVYIF